MHSRSYDLGPRCGYLGSTWSQKRHKSFDDLSGAVSLDSDFVRLLTDNLQQHFHNGIKAFCKDGQKRHHEFNVSSISKKQKYGSNVSTVSASGAGTSSSLQSNSGLVAGPSQLPSII